MAKMPILEALLKHQPSIVNSVTESDKFTPLHCSAQVGHMDGVKLLVEYGADIDAQNKWGGTPLLLAVMQNHPHVVRYLVQQGAATDVEDKWKRSAIDVARDMGSSELLELLVPGPSRSPDHGNSD